MDSNGDAPGMTSPASSAAIDPRKPRLFSRARNRFVKRFSAEKAPGNQE